MHGYKIKIWWSDEDNLFLADVPELPGCCTHGETKEEARKNAGEVIELWIDVAREFGDPVPEPSFRA